MRVLIVAALFLGSLYGGDIMLPLKGGGGNIVIHDAQFIRTTSEDSVPELSFVVENQTGAYWQTLKLQFDIGGFCKGEPTQWTIPASILTTKHKYIIGKTTPALDNFGSTAYKQVFMPLVGKIDGCTAAIIKPSVLFAENSKIQILGESGESVEIEKQRMQQELQELKIKQDAEAAAQAIRAEEERKAAEAQAKKDAIEAARRERLAAEQQKKDAELDARLVKEKAEQRRRVRAACSGIFHNTVNKKVNDLTVGEEQQVRACQALGLYPPR